MKNMSFQIRSNFLREKRGVSVMVGYVLLVTFAVIIGVITYAWIKTYVPTESLECADGVSVFLENAEFNPISKNLTVTLNNNGRFNLDGYFVHIANESGQEIPNIDISEYLFETSASGKLLGNSIRKEMRPNQGSTNIFSLPEEIGTPLRISITPFQDRVFGNRERLVVCGDSKVTQNVNVLEKLIVFVSSTGQYANFSGGSNGILRADNICNSLAGDSSLSEVSSETYVAWLSTSSVNARDRIRDGIYILPGEPLILIASGKEDLLDGDISNAINKTEEGGSQSSGGVLTGTKSDGTENENTCNDWSTTSDLVNANRGQIGSTNKEWTEYNTDYCSDTARIYCFQVS